MADKKFELEIQTKADTKGAKEAEAALNNVEKAAHKAGAASANASNPMALPAGYTPKQYESPEELQAKIDAEKKLADLMTEGEARQEKLNKAIEREAVARRSVEEWRSKQRVAAQEAEIAEVELAQATAARTAAWVASGAAIAAVAKISIDQVDKLARAMAAVDPKWAEENAVGLRFLADLKDPVGALWDTLSGGAEKSVIALAKSKQAAAEAKENLERLIEKRKEQDQAFGTRVVEEAYQREKQAIDEVIAALERKQKLESAKADAEAAADRANVAIAKVTPGADVGAAEAQAAQNNAARRQAEIDSMVEMAQAKAQQAAQLADAAISDAVGIGSVRGFSSKEYREASSRADAAQANAERLQQDLVNAKAIAEQQGAAVLADLSAEQAKITAAVRDKITGNAEAVLKDVDAKAAEIEKLPRQIQDAINLSYNSIQQKLNDAIPNEEQAGEINAQISSLQSSMGRYFGAVSQGFDQIIRDNEREIRNIYNVLRKSSVPMAPTSIR
jgi:hypothetical protein